MTLPTGTKLGRYEIRSQLGVGGMGEVYLAEDTKLGRQVALKVLPAQATQNSDNLRRFEQEARAASRLNHPNIAHIYEIGEDAGVNFIAMEYVEGESLCDRINGRPLPVSEIVSIGAQIADALDEAHSQGITHRDIKSANVMLDGRGRVKVLDFGLAKVTKTVESEEATQIKTNPGVVMGTVSYMSPEQALGRETDARTDIWSLGVILYEMATGHLPFASGSLTEKIDKIVHAQPEAVARLNYEVPPELEVITKKALRKKREERYQSARDLLVDLENLKRELDLTEHAVVPDLQSSERKVSFGSEQPTQTLTQKQIVKTDEATPIHTTSSAEYIATEIKRHKLGLAITVALLALVVAGLGYGIYKYSANKQNKTAPSPSSSQMKLTRLTTTGKATSAAISPDGRYVVYAMDDNGQQSLWMRQTATQSNVQIMPPAVNVKYSRLMFSPDGDYLFYVARENNAAPALYQIPALGGSPRKLSPNVGNFMALSPDGARVASIRRAPDEGKGVLVVSNVDGSGERRLVEHKIPERMLYPGGLGSAPAWSPAGHRIAFASYEYGIVANVVVAQVESGVEETLSSEKWYSMRQLAWLSDGSGLVMLASDQRGYPPQLWHLSYPEGFARRITNDLNSYTTVSVTADSRSLVTVQTETLSTIWVAPERDSNRARQISFGTAKIDEGAVWTPDGRIVYESRTGDSINIWIMDPDSGNQKQLTFDNGRTPDVSSDGRYIVFRSNRSVTPHIYRMEMDGSNLKQLTDGTGEFGPRMTPDGKWVYFSSRSSGNLTVWRASIDGGKITQIIDHPSYGADFSPDGKWLGCIYWSGQEDAPRTVAIIPFEGGQPVKLFDLPGANPFARWAPDGRALIYVDTRGDVSNLWTQAIDGGTPKQLTDFKQGRIFSFDYSPDGKQIALSRGTINNDVVMISNFE